MADNFWSHGRARPVRPVLARSTTTAAPSTARRAARPSTTSATWRSGTSSSCSTSAAPARGKEDFPILGDLPAQEHRHRPRPRAPRHDPAGRRQPLRDRHHPADPRQGGRADRRAYGARPPTTTSRCAWSPTTCAPRVMLIGDGVTPGNEGRGYVLRRIMRRAIRNMRLLGATRPGRSARSPTSASRRWAAVPRARDRPQARSEPSPCAEEAAFLRPSQPAPTCFDSASTSSQRVRPAMLPGDEAFLLHDTCGFPIDLTLEMAAEQGLSVDEDGLPPADARAARPRQGRRQARKKTGHADLSRLPRRRRRGRRDRVHRLRRASSARPPSAACSSTAAPRRPPPRATRSSSSSTAPRSTPRAAASSPTQGLIKLGRRRRGRGPRRAEAGPRPDRAPGAVLGGEVDVGAGRRSAAVDVERRRAISRAHTATHMVHKAFREALGETATQAGSENSPGRFRFDFPHPGAVPPARARRRRAAGQRGARSATSTSPPRS